MFSTLRNRFGIPGVISVIALVFAMLGGAYAASNSGSGKSATASAKKALRGPRGPKGATGPAGPAGAQGPAGAAGAKGDTGAAGAAGEKGATGAAGTNGTNGKTVLNGTGVPGAAVGTIGDFYIDTAAQEIYGPKAASGSNNGWGIGTSLQGTDGTDGEPWVVGTAPSGALLKGTWSVGGTAKASNQAFPITFSTTVPVSPGEFGLAVISVPPGGPDGTGLCSGTPSAPTPAPISGVLCAYAEVSTNLQLPGPTEGAVGLSGGGLVGKAGANGEGPVQAYGSWAMTAP